MILEKGNIVLAICLVAVSIIAYGVITSETTYETRLVETVEIHSLSLDDNTEINFVLGTGSSRLHLDYYFFKSWGDGKRLSSVNALDTKIIETNEQVPTLRRYEIIKLCSFFSFLIEFTPIGYYNEMIVPMNTTQTSFTAEV